MDQKEKEQNFLNTYYVPKAFNAMFYLVITITLGGMLKQHKEASNAKYICEPLASLILYSEFTALYHDA